MTNKEKETAFTINRIPFHNKKNAKQGLKNLQIAIADSLIYPDEEKAWNFYIKAAIQILDKHKLALSEEELIPSFRTQRQKAYNEAVKRYSKETDNIVGLKFLTQKDERVREDHKQYHGIVRSVNDKIWEKITPPLDFQCRCFLQPVIKQNYKETPKAKLPKIPKEKDFEQRPAFPYKQRGENT